MALGIALSAAEASAACAQAGSTGGTLGNTDKSISGERREESPRNRKRENASRARLERRRRARQLLETPQLALAL